MQFALCTKLGYTSFMKEFFSIAYLSPIISQLLLIVMLSFYHGIFSYWHVFPTNHLVGGGLDAARKPPCIYLIHLSMFPISPRILLSVCSTFEDGVNFPPVIL